MFYFRIFFLGVGMLVIGILLGMAAYSFTTQHVPPLLPFIAGLIFLWLGAAGFGLLGLFLVVTGFIDFIDFSPKAEV